MQTSALLRNRQPALLIISMLICGLISIFHGKELSWDLAFYHFYNPYAFLHHRSLLDYWPASYAQAFFNPAMDFLSYFLITFLSPLKAEFLLGAIHGINYWLLFHINLFFFRKTNPAYAVPLALVFALAGLYSAITLSEIGSFLGDDLASIFVLGAVLLWLMAIEKSQVSRYRMTFASAVLLGMGAGLKLTLILFVAGFAIALLVFPVAWRQRIALLFTWGTGIGIGVLLSSGFWMWHLWQHYHNPVLPFLNGLFHSPDLPAGNWHDTRLLPKTLWQTLFYPFYFSWHGTVAENPYRDIRFIVIYVFFVLSACALVFRKKSASVAVDYPAYWLCAFFLFSYIVWQYYFSNMRYLVTLEMLSPLVIYLLARRFLPAGTIRIVVVSSVLFLIGVTMKPMITERVPYFGNDYFSITLPEGVTTTPEAMVLMAFPPYAMTLTPYPQAYLIPFFPPQWHFVGVPVLAHGDYSLSSQIENRTASYTGKFYLLTTASDMPTLYMAAQALGLKKAGECGTIDSHRQHFNKLINNPILLCPVTK